MRQTPQFLVTFDHVRCCPGSRLHVGQAGHTTSLATPPPSRSRTRVFLTSSRLTTHLACMNELTLVEEGKVSFTKLIFRVLQSDKNECSFMRLRMPNRSCVPINYGTIFKLS